MSRRRYGLVQKTNNLYMTQHNTHTHNTDEDTDTDTLTTLIQKQMQIQLRLQLHLFITIRMQLCRNQSRETVSHFLRIPFISFSRWTFYSFIL